jgi:hypothetical protein
VSLLRGENPAFVSGPHRGPQRPLVLPDRPLRAGVTGTARASQEACPGWDRGEGRCERERLGCCVRSSGDPDAGVALFGFRVKGLRGPTGDFLGR